MSPSRAPARELLLANHVFPGEYMIKAFGPASTSFRDGVAVAVRGVVETRSDSTERTTRSGRSVCITVRLQVNDVDEVIDVYERLYAVQDLRMIL